MNPRYGCEMSKDSEDREPGRGTEASKVQDYIVFYRGVYLHTVA
jgi:hypothetical protein